MINTIDDIGKVKCASDEFQCKKNPNECVFSAYVCDGIKDCSNGADEDKCTGQVSLDAYAKIGNHRLNVPYIERYLQATPKACARYCDKAEDFKCISFNYQAAKRLCILNELNVGMTGKLVTDRNWDYYELRSETKLCEVGLKCRNGKCLQSQQMCDGKHDCGNEDQTDEQNCSTAPNIQVKLSGSSITGQGFIEIKAFNHPYGGICDDGFGIEEAHVICRMAGYPLGK